MEDRLPILAADQLEATEDAPDTAKFQELPPPYSETDPRTDHVPKQALHVVSALTVTPRTLLRAPTCLSCKSTAGAGTSSASSVCWPAYRWA
jgi:hypothetical protein